MNFLLLSLFGLIYNYIEFSSEGNFLSYFPSLIKFLETQSFFFCKSSSLKSGLIFISNLL